MTRVGQPDDDIDGAFKKAKDVMLELISLFARIEPQDTEFEYASPGKDDAPDLVVFSGTKALDFGAPFRRELLCTSSRRNGARSRALRRSPSGRMP
jgi:hypothetical protein